MRLIGGRGTAGRYHRDQRFTMIVSGTASVTPLAPSTQLQNKDRGISSRCDRTDKDPARKGIRDERLEARVTKEQKALFVRAAELQGRSLTDFLVASAQEAAMKAVCRHGAMRLSERERQAFVSALLNPPSPARALENAGKRYRERTRG